MLKCEECGDEFSYGRKINCCKSIYFGMIFSNRKKDHKWNCNPDIISQESSKRFRYQRKMEIKDYIILYE
ncbi:MAG: hypothetical protein ACFE9S_08995 [Candidatus Hermodarchaeota archaeon]